MPIVRVLLIALVPTLCWGQKSEVEPSSDEILQKVRKVYATCTSLQAVGTKVETLSSNGRPFQTRDCFRVAFDRSGRFRLEHQSRTSGEFSMYIVHCQDEQTRTYWDLDGAVEDKVGLEQALGEANGVTSGAACELYGMLFPQARVPGNQFLRVTQAERLADQQLLGVTCYRIRGPTWRGSNTLWIDKETHLVLRVIELSGSVSEEDAGTVEQVESVEVTDYYVQVNEEVPPAAFEFRAPHAGRDKIREVRSVEAQLLGALLIAAKLTPAQSAALLSDYSKQSADTTGLRFEPFAFQWIEQQMGDGKVKLSKCGRRLLVAGLTMLLGREWVDVDAGK